VSAPKRSSSSPHLSLALDDLEMDLETPTDTSTAAGRPPDDLSRNLARAAISAESSSSSRSPHPSPSSSRAGAGDGDGDGGALNESAGLLFALSNFAGDGAGEMPGVDVGVYASP